MPIRDWKAAMNRFAIQFEDGFRRLKRKPVYIEFSTPPRSRESFTLLRRGEPALAYDFFRFLCSPRKRTIRNVTQVCLDALRPGETASGLQSALNQIAVAIAIAVECAMRLPVYIRRDDDVGALAANAVK